MPGHPLGTLTALLLFVVLPIVVCVVVGVLAWLPAMVRSPRYRPQRGWAAAPLWFEGPSDVDGALAEPVHDDLVRGGAGGHW